MKRLLAFSLAVVLALVLPMAPVSADVTEVKLIASDGAKDDFFGGSVSISGDTAVVGAYWADINDKTNAGAAYVFVRNGSTWSQQAKLTASDNAVKDSFGQSVSISGDTVVVGAIGADINNYTNAGAAYVFVRTDTTWSQQAKLIADDGRASDYFGYSVSISGDTVVVGATQGDGKVVNSGSAYVFVRNGTTWSPPAELKAGDGAAYDFFGQSVSISGNTVVVGARQGDGKVVNSGSAYVFVRNGTTWSEQAELTAGDGVVKDYFGNSVSISGDTAVVGAHENDDKGTDSGSAYVFERNGDDWSQQDKLLAGDGAAYDYFGISVSINNGDTVVVGAHGADINGKGSAGAAYVFERTDSWSQQAKLTASDNATGDQFGNSVSISEDTAVVGAYGADINGNTDSGSAYVYAEQQYTLTINVVGSGSVTPHPDEETYTQGTDVTLTADPADGWVFDSWSGDLDGTDNPVTITMDGDKTVTAVFTHLQYTLTIDTDGEGDVSQEPMPPYYQGDDTVVTLTATPDTGWAFDYWEGDLSGSTNPDTITMDGDKTVTAVFRIAIHTVKIDIKPGSEPNSINPDSKGVIPVAILTTPDFDAASVNASTVTFGPGVATMVHKKAHLEDVDEDGDIDMILHFKTQETGIAEGDTEATLTGKTTDGKDIIGTDSVITVPPEGKGK